MGLNDFDFGYRISVFLGTFSNGRNFEFVRQAHNFSRTERGDMKKDAIEIVVVLDRSGSMASVEKDTKGGFDKFIEEQKKAKGEATLTLVQFNTVYEFVHKSKPIKDVPPLEFVPRGSTALLDAIGRAIAETGERLKALPESERPEKVVFVIITDGEENASKEFKKEKINDMIKHQTDIYKWEFVFLGANQDAIQAGQGLGISGLNSMTYAANSKGVHAAFATTAQNLSNLRSGVVQTMNYSAQNRQDAVDEDLKP